MLSKRKTSAYLRNLLGTVIKNVWSRKKKSLLAVLGIFIGVAAVITLVSLGGSTRLKLLHEIEKLGTNQLIIEATRVARSDPGRGGSPSSSGSGSIARTLSEEDAFLLKDIEEVESVLSLYIKDGVEVKIGTSTFTTSLRAASPEYPHVLQVEPQLGRFFTEEEDRAYRRVVLLGKTVALELFGSLDASLGEQIRVNSIPFEVIGVIEEIGIDSEGEDQDDYIIIPITTAQQRVFGESHLTHLYMYVKEVEMLDAVVGSAGEILRESHGLSPDEADDFKILNRMDLLETHSLINKTLENLIFFLAFITLMSGGLGIMAIMLMSLRETAWEVGLRRALGATSVDILLQFLLEAIILSLGGGLSGIIVGGLVTLTFTYFLQLPIYVSLNYILVSLVVSIGLGLVFGVYPSLKAAKLDPAEALRSH